MIIGVDAHCPFCGGFHFMGDSQGLQQCPFFSEPLTSQPGEAEIAIPEPPPNPERKKE